MFCGSSVIVSAKAFKVARSRARLSSCLRAAGAACAKKEVEADRAARRSERGAIVSNWRAEGVTEVGVWSRVQVKSERILKGCCDRF